MVQSEYSPRVRKEGSSWVVPNQKGNPGHDGTFEEIQNNIKFEKHEDLYKKYRNHIIEMAKDHYLTQS
jgi:hypothetical protein